VFAIKVYDLQYAIYEFLVRAAGSIQNYSPYLGGKHTAKKGGKKVGIILCIQSIAMKT
jgi:hypothetical protein